MKLNSRDVEDSEQADVFERSEIIDTTASVSKENHCPDDFFTKSGSEKFDFSTPEVTANVPKTNQAFLSSDLDISVIDSDVEGRNTSSLLGLESEPLQENLNDEFMCPDSPLIIEKGRSKERQIHYHLAEQICNMSFVIVQARTLERIIYNDNVSTKALKYGLANEAVALNQYKEKHMGKNIRRCGLFIDPKYPFLCTSRQMD
ncbi:uncharacterized protein LOC118199489 [Stegodyphus dumicola]|uniref:uncharacterized protein LOC118199489 n=1 Tax=Stegodyphus dumicola TaxID=202533 RepID=UPI0015B0A68E|nr:uncharacterized protein LOC118199489 [Stegodyphus dumicola]